jgi:tetratricopeptide (TPR) repeat protein
MTPFEHYGAALRSLQLGEGDALVHARRAVAASPRFVAAHQLAATLLLYSRDPRDFREGSAVFARLAKLPMDARERVHAGALQLAIEGDYRAARAAYDAILFDAPHDFLALWGSQLIDYYLGEPQALRLRAERVLPAWSAGHAGYHAVLAMHAFGLEECGDYAAAEKASRRALELEPRDLRALHALLHVFEMQGRPEEGLRRIGARARHETLPNHLWWHAALFHLQADRPEAALGVYERWMRLGGLAELIDASALLWRLSLAGMEVGAWFSALAGRWAPHAGDGYCAFNDLHATMAFVGAERWALAEQVLAAQERRLSYPHGANYEMTRSVGLPACRALVAFGRGRYPLAERLLRALPPVAHRIGGSHAQRYVLQLTRAAAASASLRSSSRRVLQSGDARLDGRVRGEDLRHARAARDAERLDRVGQAARLQAAEAAQRGDHRLRRMQQVR